MMRLDENLFEAIIDREEEFQQFKKDVADGNIGGQFGYDWYEDMVDDAYSAATSKYKKIEIEPSIQAGKGGIFIYFDGLQSEYVKDFEEECEELYDLACEATSYREFKAAVRNYVRNLVQKAKESIPSRRFDKVLQMLLQAGKSLYGDFEVDYSAEYDYRQAANVKWVILSRPGFEDIDTYDDWDVTEEFNIRTVQDAKNFLQQLDWEKVNNVNESLDMSKDEYLRNAAEITWESGHGYDPDDFSYFKKVCKEDGWNVTEEDFQKYFEYLDEIRANQFADEDEVDLGDWEEMESKQVEDSDGFMTDYTWYVKDNDDGSETHVMIFGDQDLYNPLNSEPDAEFDAEDIAREWFDNYHGFAEEELEEAVLMENSEDELTMRDVVKQIVDRFGNYKYQYNLKAEEYVRYGFENASIYNKKFLAPNNYLALFSMLLHKAPTVANLEEYFDPDELLKFFEKNPTFNDLYDHAQSVWWGDGDDFIISVDNLTTGENLYEAEYENSSYSDDTDTDYDFDDEELDEAVNNEAELVNGYKVFKADSTNTWFVMDGQDYHNESEFEGKGYPTKEQAIERANSLEKGTATTLEEAIKPDIESEQLQALAKKHNLKLICVTDDGDLKMEGNGADLMKFYQEAEKLGLWEVDSKLFEALHGFKELEEFTSLANELGFYGPAQMKHIMDAAHKLGKSELEMLKSLKDTFDGKIPDSLIDGLTDEFLAIAPEVGITTDEDYREFLKREVEPGETITQAIKRYRDELYENDIDVNSLEENLLNEIAMVNIDKQAIFDSIANARAYVQENKFEQAIDSLHYAAKLLKSPIQEGAMKSLSLDIDQAGGE